VASVRESKSAWPRARSCSSPLRKSFLVLHARLVLIRLYGGTEGIHSFPNDKLIFFYTIQSVAFYRAHNRRSIISKLFNYLLDTSFNIDKGSHHMGLSLIG